MQKGSSSARWRLRATRARRCYCRSRCGRRRKSARVRPIARGRSGSPTKCRTSWRAWRARLQAIRASIPTMGVSACCELRAAPREAGPESLSRSRTTPRCAPPPRLQPASCALASNRRTCAAHAPSRRLLHAAALVNLVEPGEGIGLQRAAEIAQMLLRMFPAAIRRVRKPHCRSFLAGGRTIIANISPQPPGLRLACPGASTGTGVSSPCTLLAAST